MDGITDGSMAGVYSGNGSGYPPCTAEACIQILDHYGIDLKGKNVAVIGRSQVIGKPVSMMLIKKNATVTVCHTKTADMAGICKDKDIIIAAAGHIGTVTEDFLSPGQIVIDVAINFDDEGNMCGDVEFDPAQKVVEAITPVPGGVGTVTTSMLMKHVIQAAEKNI
jgi:methylenetetrahydrofolate dehydrogenase (NADP+)/methenyltetrahydrofolate cyclohydrolase